MGHIETSCGRVTAPRMGRLFFVFCLLLLPAGPAGANYGGGSGTADDPYLIYSAEQMNTIGLHKEDWDQHFKLMADLDLSAYQGTSFNRIGFHDPTGSPAALPTWRPPFSGTFDGNGHTISGFTCVIDARVPLAYNPWRGDENVGLFGYVQGPAASIKNLGLIDPNIGPARTCTERIERVGALVGHLREGTIENCYVRGGTISADTTVGGLVGNSAGRLLHCHTTGTVRWAEGRSLRPLEDPSLSATGGAFGGLAGSSTGAVSFCHSSATVCARNGAGGLLGRNGSTTAETTEVVSDCYATGDVSAQENVGGLVGWNYATIRACHATGAVNGNQWVGGLVGYSSLETSAIETSHATGRVSGDSYVGGLAGSSGGTVQACYATGQVAGEGFVGGLTGLNLGAVRACYATGDVTGNIRRTGGLTGLNSGTVSCCYARGDVAGNQAVGGLIGITANTGQTQYCYATGRVSGKENVGGLIGDNRHDVTGCFWDVETSGWPTSGGGTGKTTAEMQDPATFLAAGWDFVDETANGTEDTWRMSIDPPMCPRLAWEWQQGARRVIYATTLDTDPGWTTQGPWQFGPPAGRGGSECGNPDPNSSSTGMYVYGVNLNGDYNVPPDGVHYLSAGPFDCRGYRSVQLQFARWLNTDSARNVDAMAEVSRDGTSWTTVWKYAGTEGELADGIWKTVVYDIRGTADDQPEVYIRWGYEVLSEEARPMSGWNIDDVTLTGLQN